ncbi:tetratricopeptide repeat-containing sensor histidine kinase [Pedobacter arcticus]|uniref:tetratricopeptide repeat-containing sensor histidine kinase n=1 Tax=Pedobacter arcticus TaxID=752140 RepID=UPI0003671899|nr:tetratricopeptide repeat-containing sensor histidine kinase [Pedobacter arcticus]
MKFKLLFCLLLILYVSGFAQNADSLKKQIQQVTTDTAKITLLNKLATVYAQQGRGKEAIEAYGKVVFLAKRNRALLAKTYNGIGSVEADLGRNAEALKAYQSGLKFTSENDFSLKADINKNIGALYLSWKKLDDALKYDNIAEYFAIKGKDERTVADLANNKGAVYEQKQQFDKAQNNYQKALRFYLKEKINDRICLTYNNLAILAKVQKQFKLATDYYVLAVTFATKADNKWLTAAIGNNLGNLLSETGEYERADIELNNALKLENEIKAGELIPETLENIADNEKRRGNFKKAFEYMKLTAAEKSKFINLENTKELTQLQEEFDAVNRQKKIELLSKESKIHQLTLSKKNTTILLISGAFLAIGFISFLAFSRYKLRHESKIKLATADAKSQVQEEKLRISRELHDNIGAQLSFINGSIQSLASADIGNQQLQQTQQVTQNTIKELRSTVWLINQQEFDLDAFVVKLREYLKPYYGSKPEIKIDNQSDKDYVLEPIIATNLFRIIQELVNNALKYSEANELVVNFNAVEGSLKVTVVDDGIGYDSSTKSSGYGLRNIEERIKTIGGNHKVTTSLGDGTRFVLNIPI